MVSWWGFKMSKDLVSASKDGREKISSQNISQCRIAKNWGLLHLEYSIGDFCICEDAVGGNVYCIIGIVDIYDVIKTTSFPRKPVDWALPGVVDWPAHSPRPSPNKNVWCIIKRRIRKWWLQTVDKVMSRMSKALVKLQQLVSSVPKQCVEHGKMNTVVNVPLSQCFFECVSDMKL